MKINRLSTHQLSCQQGSYGLLDQVLCKAFSIAGVLYGVRKNPRVGRLIFKLGRILHCSR